MLGLLVGKFDDANPEISLSLSILLLFLIGSYTRIQFYFDLTKYA